MDTTTISTIAIYALPVLFAITLHEAAHAYAAKYFGDATAFLAGRTSMNPIRHIDVFGTIIMPVALALMGAPVLGYAKPVPIEARNLRNPKRQMAWVALAGPMSNLAMAIGWAVLGILLKALNSDDSFLYFLSRMAGAGLFVNVLMFTFNLFPLPPLDGGRVLTGLLPHRYANKFAQIEPYGFFIVLALLYFQILNFWMVPMVGVTNLLIYIVTFPLSFLLN